MIANRRTLLILIVINALVYLAYRRTIPPGSLDFRAFYYAGQTIRKAPAHLYDPEDQRVGHTRGFGKGSTFFVHPPHEVLIFAPLSMVPYDLSFNLWRVLSLLCLVVAALLFCAATGASRTTALMLFLAMAPVAVCVLIGQDSLLLLLLLCGCFYLLKQERDLAAALVLSLALFKPQIPAIMAIAILAIGRKRFFASFAAAGAAIAAASLAFVGTQGVHQMLRTENLAEIWVYSHPTVRGLMAFVAGDHPRTAYALLVIALIAMFPVWRRSGSLDFAVASGICVGCVFTPYLFFYDMVVLAIPLALTMQKPRKVDAVVALPLLSAPFVLVMTSVLHLSSWLVLPSVALGLMTFRLGSPARESVPALEADLQLS